MSKFKSYFKLIAGNALISLVLVELIAMAYIEYKNPHLPAYDRIPTYLQVMRSNQMSFASLFNGTADTVYSNPISPRCIDTAYPWCTWHPLNRIHREVYPCFNVIYKFTAIGTRGSLPNPKDSNTILFIGDSFVEGFGLDEDSTLPERIHRHLKKPTLNLGTSGHFGTTQMSMVYAHFAKQYKHKQAVVVLFPENDFSENNVASHYKYFSHRYRPYRVLKGDTSEIIYRGSMDSTSFSWQHFKVVNKIVKPVFSKGESIFSKLLKLTYTRRLFSMLKYNAFTKHQVKEKPDEINYTSTDLKILEIDLKTMLNTAKQNGAQLTFLVIPSQNFLVQSTQNKAYTKDFENLELCIRQMVEKDGGHYISFFQYIKSNDFPIQPLFFQCDSHLSNHGERILSQFLGTEIGLN